MAPALTVPQSMSVREWLRVVGRVLAMLAALLIVIPFYYIYWLLRLDNPFPRIFLGLVALFSGVQIVPKGHKPTGPVFLISNHVSWIDIPAIAWITGSAFVGHDGLAAMPVLKWLCKMNDTVFVARHDRTSVADQVEQVRHAMDDTHALTIFPEGTTSDGTGLLPFKSSLLSAFEPLPQGVAIQPVLLDYGADAASIAWIGEEHGLDNFLRILARTEPLRVTVTFLPPLEGAALENRKTIAQAAREALLRELNG